MANILAALAFFFSTAGSPVVALAATVFFLLLPQVAEAVKLVSQEWGGRLGAVFDYRGHLDLTQAPVARSFEFYFVGVAHALDYLVIVLLLAFIVFRRRSLLPPQLGQKGKAKSENRKLKIGEENCHN